MVIPTCSSSSAYQPETLYSRLHPMVAFLSYLQPGKDVGDSDRLPSRAISHLDASTVLKLSASVCEITHNMLICT